MKKRVLIYISLLLVTFVITGCVENKMNNENGGGSENAPAINGNIIKLTYDNNFEELHYKENLSEFYGNTMGALKFFSYRKDGNTLLELRMGYIKNKTLDQTKKELDFNTSIKKVGNLEFLYGETVLKYNDGGEYKAHQYFYEFNSTTYTLIFISNENITEFENAFMSNVYFK